MKVVTTVEGRQRPLTAADWCCCCASVRWQRKDQQLTDGRGRDVEVEEKKGSGDGSMYDGVLFHLSMSCRPVLKLTGRTIS